MKAKVVAFSRKVTPVIPLKGKGLNGKDDRTRSFMSKVEKALINRAVFQ
jgi:hypothetical protein